MAMKTRPSAKTGEAMIELRERTPGAEASGHPSGCVKPPDFVTRRCVVGAQPAISPPKSTCVRRGRWPPLARPLPVQHVLARADRAPDDSARVLVHRDQTWCTGRWTRVWPSFRPLEVDTISRSPTGNTSLLVASCGKTPSGRTCPAPRRFRRRVVLEGLFPIRTTILAIAQALDVEATELALGGDIVQMALFHIRALVVEGSRNSAGRVPLAGPSPARGTCRPPPERP